MFMVPIKQGLRPLVGTVQPKCPANATLSFQPPNEMTKGIAAKK